MAEKELQRLATEALDRFDILAVRVEHSRGVVANHACSFRLRIASAHRKEGLAAMDWYIDAAGLEDIPVTTPEAYQVLFARNADNSLKYQAVIDACDVIFVSYYPFWTTISVDEALAAVDAWHDDVLSLSGGKAVYVAESGWPSDGDGPWGDAVPSDQNAADYLVNFVSWAQANDVSYFYFEAFDENWKSEPNGVGPHWGLRAEDGTAKDGLLRVCGGERTPDNWSGDPVIELTYVPEYGSTADLEGTIGYVSPLSYEVAVYIKVGGGWWTKPTFASPLTTADLDGAWICDITTGPAGTDEYATEIAAYLWPIGLGLPPQADNAVELPPELETLSAASVHVLRDSQALAGGDLQAGYVGTMPAAAYADDLTTATALFDRRPAPIQADLRPLASDPGNQLRRAFLPAHDGVLSIPASSPRRFSGADQAITDALLLARPQRVDDTPGQELSDVSLRTLLAFGSRANLLKDRLEHIMLDVLTTRK